MATKFRDSMVRAMIKHQFKVNGDLAVQVRLYMISLKTLPRLQIFRRFGGFK